MKTILPLTLLTILNYSFAEARNYCTCQCHGFVKISKNRLKADRPEYVSFANLRGGNCGEFNSSKICQYESNNYPDLISTGKTRGCLPTKKRYGKAEIIP